MEQLPTELDHLPEISLDDPNWPTLKDYLNEYYQQLGSQGEGLKTYFEEFDKQLEGMRGIVIIGGEPGSGKTALALQIGYDSAADGIPVVIYSFEMPKAQVVTRFFQRAGKIRYQAMQQKPDKLIPEDLERLKNTEEEIRKVAPRIIIRETKDFLKKSSQDGSMNALFDFGAQIQQIERVTQEFGKPPLIIIDSLHEIPVDQKYSRELKQKIDHLMLNLRNMCDQTGATFLIISHQSRSGQSSGGLQSFMGSASIEYTVDMALIISLPSGDAPNEKERELTVAKNRYGTKPKARLHFNGVYMDFAFIELINGIGLPTSEKPTKGVIDKIANSI